MTWLDDISLALRIHGGTAHLSDLYVTIGTIRAALGRSLPPQFEAVIRRALQDGRGRDFYSMRGDGYWSLNSRYQQ